MSAVPDDVPVWPPRSVRDLYVVTHTEATHHVDRLVGGWYDAALTPRGLNHAALVAAALRKRLPVGEDVAVFSSDLVRCRETAAPIAEILEVDVVVDAGLRERTYGIREGSKVGTAPYVPPPADGDRMNHRDGVEGSETRLEWAGRAYSAVDGMLADGIRHTVVVTHGGTATFVIARWIGLPLDACPTTPTATSSAPRSFD